MTDQTAVVLGEEHLLSLVVQALCCASLRADAAESMGRSIVACERDGVRNHGLLRLDALVRSLESGWIDGAAVAEVVAEKASLIAVDAHNGFTQAALAQVRERLVSKARASGVATLVIRNAHHFSALWPDLEPFAAEGLLAFSGVNSKKRMAIWGSREPVVGTNAMGFAAPREGHEPLVWDQSSSVMAHGEVLLAAKEGWEVPAGVGTDSNGAGTQDPNKILAGGALLPFGGTKGGSMAVMVELLTAALSGGEFGFEADSSAESSTTSKSSQFILLIDPEATTLGLPARVEEFCAEVIRAGGTRIPADRRYRQRALSNIHGISIDEQSYLALLAHAGVPTETTTAPVNNSRS